MTKQLSINTRGEGDILNVTGDVAEPVIESSLKNGVVTTIGLCLTVPLVNGRLTLGTWQQTVAR